MKRQGNRDPERGVALVITLLVVVLLTTVILEFDRNVRTDLLAAENFRDGTKAFYLAQSGVSAAKAVLRDDIRHSPLYDAFDELWAMPFPPYPVGDGTVTVSIQDESGKLNPNHLVGGNDLPVPKKVAQMKKLFELLNVDVDLVDAIIDWVDENGEAVSALGAEDDYYRNREPPYFTKNQAISVLSELNLVRGMTDEVYALISPYLTVSGGVVTALKEGPININTAESAVLQSLPSIAGDEFPVTESLAERIMEGRPYKQESDLDKVSGMSKIAQDVRRYYSTKSDHFTIMSSGNVNGMIKTLRVIVKREGARMTTLFWRME